MSARCPRCRSLGLSTDCAEELIHGQPGMNHDGDYELEVTMTFPVPVTSTLPLDPVEMATHMREVWLSEDTVLADLLIEAAGDDFDLQVRPVFGS